VPPVLVTKVVVLNSGREHEEFVRHHVLFQRNQPLFRVDGADFVEQQRAIFLAVQDGEERPGNFVGQPRAHLVEHGTEEMVVPFVDQRHADGSPGQRVRRKSPPKPPPTITACGRVVLKIASRLPDSDSAIEAHGGISVRAHRSTDCQSVGICSFPRRAWKSGVPAVYLT